MKNRYNDPTVNKRFVLGIDRSKMKLYDVELNAQHDLVNNGQEAENIPVFDKSESGARYEKFGKLKV